MSKVRRIELGPSERIVAIVPHHGYAGVRYLDLLIEDSLTRKRRIVAIQRDEMSRDMMTMFATFYAAYAAIESAVLDVVKEQKRTC